MSSPVRFIVAALALLCAGAAAQRTRQTLQSPPRPVSVLTQRYDNLRSGVNRCETVLNAGNVNAAHFGKLFTRSVDGDMYAQPLYVPRVRLASGMVRNVVYVATAHNSVYAFDADDPEAFEPLWQVHLGPAVPKGDVGQECGNYRDFETEIGITGTPVIDAAARTMYLVARNKNADDSYHQMLHALDIASGAEKTGSPVEITASSPGTGDGAEAGRIQFNARTQNQRAALLLLNGIVYVTWASHCDTKPYHGWIMAYNAHTLQQVAALNLTPNGSAGGIWQAGTGPAADNRGNIYLTTGNGTSTAYDGGSDYGECMLRLSIAGGQLRIADWFTPYDFEEDNRDDTDIGSCGSLLIPDANLVVTGNKRGMLYLVRMGDMGEFYNDDAQIVQRLQGLHGHIHGTPIYWKSPRYGPLLYVWSENDRLQAFRLTGGRLAVSPLMQSAMVAPQGMPGGFLALSTNGDDPGSGIVWASHPLVGDANHATVPGILRAFDASNLSRQLWNSQQNARRDEVGSFAKFCTPTVANGKVYLATFSRQLLVYGLNPPPVLARPKIEPHRGKVGTPVTISCTAPGAAIRYTLDGSDPTRGSALYTRPLLLDDCATIKARAFRRGHLESAVATALCSRDGVTGHGSGLTGSYFKTDNLIGSAIRRIDPIINFSPGDSPPLDGIEQAPWSVRWTGFVQPRFTDTYTFYTVAGDAVVLWVNGRKLIDDWTYHDTAKNQGVIKLEAGQQYPIRLEYSHNLYQQVCQLWWSSACQAKEIVPRSQLYPE